MNDTKFYIAYGSNLNIRQMAIRCPTAKAVRTAVLKNYQLVFCRYATIIPTPDSETPVAIWEIDSACEKALDRYEGYPDYYTKDYLDVEVNGRTVRAMIYLMNQPAYCLPSTNYFNTVLEGYHDVGLNPQILYSAYRFSKQQVDSGNLYPFCIDL